MEGSLSTFIYISVAILVTLAIASMAFVAISLVGDIFGKMDEQDITIKAKFDEVSELYNGRELKGIDLLNLLREYRHIDMMYPVVISFTDMNMIISEDGTEYYNLGVIDEDTDGLTEDDITNAIERLTIEMTNSSADSTFDGMHYFNYEDRYNVSVLSDIECKINGEILKPIIIQFTKKVYTPEGG